MHKTWLIIKREFLTRVRKKTFIIGTLLFPLLYLLLIFGTGYIAEKTKKTLNVAIIDSSGQQYFSRESIDKSNRDDPSSVLTLIKENAKGVIADHKQLGYDGYVIVPAMDWNAPEKITHLLFKSNKSFGTGNTDLLSAKLNNIWDDIKNEKLGIDEGKRQIISTNRIIVRPFNIEDEHADAATSRAIGWVCGFLIYFIILVYGSQVMMGVMEEKTNRIAEIIVSSVKPFQMMLGKIIGIALVALTQFLLWIIFILVIYNVTKLSSEAGASTANQLVGGVQRVFTSVNLPLTLGCFAFYFLGGFFFYSAIYGAIGSAINEDVREAQSLAFPVTMIVIISIALMSSTVENPTGPVAVWASIIPFTSPIVMMSRIPYGVPGTVPYWQLGLSMMALVIGFLFTTWFAGKIYRTGILMYGKKASWKEMIKWAIRKS